MEQVRELEMRSMKLSCAVEAFQTRFYQVIPNIYPIITLIYTLL